MNDLRAEIRRTVLSKCAAAAMETIVQLGQSEATQA